MRATRMGDDLFGAFRDGIKEMPDTEQYTHDTADALFDEAERARSEEARLLEENRKQAEQIKALTDALEKAIAGCRHEGEMPDAHWDEVTVALRLARGLP